MLKYDRNNGFAGKVCPAILAWFIYVSTKPTLWLHLKCCFVFSGLELMHRTAVRVRFSALASYCRLDLFCFAVVVCLLFCPQDIVCQECCLPFCSVVSFSRLKILQQLWPIIIVSRNRPSITPFLSCLHTVSIQYQIRAKCRKVPTKLGVKIKCNPSNYR